MSKDRDPNNRAKGAGTPNEEAASWVVRLASDQRTRGEIEAFEAWCAQDPRNPDDYVDHALLWNGVAALADNDTARARLGVAKKEPARVLAFPSRRRMLEGLALAAAASAAYFVAPGLLSGGGETYATGIGEQRRIILADGSRIMLNTDSALRVDLGEIERRLFLERGQAFFQVAADPSRPFRVFVGNDEVRAVGTAFEIWRSGTGARVTLEEGVVAIYRGRGMAELPRPAARPRAGPAPAALLEAGQQVELQPNLRLAAREVDVATTQAWRSGRMILDDVPLDEVVRDINRYGGRQIVLGDPRIRPMRLSGVFHTSQPEALVDGISAALPVRLARQDDATLVLTAR